MFCVVQPKISRESMTHHLLRLYWLIQKKIPAPLMVELLSRISIDGQVNINSSLSHTLSNISITQDENFNLMFATPLMANSLNLNSAYIIRCLQIFQ